MLRPAAQAELGRLKREAAARRAAKQAAQQAAQPPEPAARGLSADPAVNGAVPAADAPPVITEDLLRTLKVSWSAKVGSGLTFVPSLAGHLALGRHCSIQQALAAV